MPAWGRHALFGILIGVSSLGATSILASILGPNGLTRMEGLVLALFMILFLWISTSFWMAFVGFCLELADQLIHRRRPPIVPLSDPQDPGEALQSRTALVMPIHNEDVESVFARIRTMYEGLRDAAGGTRFDVFILSDTSDPDIWVAEELAWDSLCRDVQGWERVFYRHRPNNSGHKSGNIADFCRRWGRLYDYMVVLDADSLMGPGTVIELVRRMDANSDVGLIQVPPVPIFGETLFARTQQFAADVYGPLLMRGAAFWHGGDGNYWGHNAIIRIRSFMQSCGLPELPGRWPSGGEILSHDFVEAALLRRNGWRVWLAPDLAESYEEPPADLMSYLKRDRRWCQGNLQHFRLVFAHGLHPMSRLHLTMGVMSYLASPLWFLFLVFSFTDVMRSSFMTHQYFPGDGLFPAWPASHATQVTMLLSVTFGILFLPKILGLALLTTRTERLRAHGGYIAATLSVILESLLAFLLAPVLMVFQSRFVIAFLLGRKTEWTSQRRSGGRAVLKRAVHLHLANTILAAGALGGVYWLTPGFFPWMVPVLIGPILSIPLAMALDSVVTGQLARRAGLFLTMSETRRSQFLRMFKHHRQRRTLTSYRDHSARSAVCDPYTNALHILLLRDSPATSAVRRNGRSAVEVIERYGFDELAPPQRYALLSDSVAMAAAHALAWSKCSPEAEHAVERSGRARE